MGKLIFLVLIVVLAWAALKSYRKSKTRENSPHVAAAEDMVRCTHCGVHLPRSEGHLGNGKIFCSEEHLRLHR